MKHHQPLSPERIWDITDAISEAADNVRAQYKDAFAYVYGPKDKPTDEQDQRISLSHVSDPTGEAATSQLGARRKLRNVSNDLERFRDRLLKIEEGLLRLFDTPDDDYQPLSSFALGAEKKSKQAQEGERARDKRDLTELERRLVGKLEQVRSQLRRVG